MKVTIAGNVKDIKEGTTLAQLVVDEKVENPEYVTVTVNDDIVENHDHKLSLKAAAQQHFFCERVLL